MSSKFKIDLLVVTIQKTIFFRNEIQIVCLKNITKVDWIKRTEKLVANKQNIF